MLFRPVWVTALAAAHAGTMEIVNNEAASSQLAAFMRREEQSPAQNRVTNFPMTLFFGIALWNWSHEQSFTPDQV
jgi:hypothetical protein